MQDNTAKVTKRKDIPDKYKWKLEDMFADEELWEAQYEKSLKLAEDFAKYQGRLTSSAETLYEALTARDAVWQSIEKVFVYARMRRDEDNSSAKYQSMTGRAGSLMAKASALMSFFTPELLSAPEELILSYLKEEPLLEKYDFLLHEILREKAHVLSPAEENLMASLSEVLGASGEIFSMLNNADMKFGEIKDENGKAAILTHGNYVNFMEEGSRELRKAAFEKMYKAYKDHINTISSAYNFNVKTDCITAKIRKYPSALEASLFGDEVPKEVYENLISEVHKGFPAMYRYMKLRKKLLGLDELHMYDIYAKLIKLPREKKYSFEEACEIMYKALSPLGGDYVEAVREGISSGWIDVFENEGKTSGAYSFGSYDSMPYILLNFQGRLQDIFTLVHEMGHSMHSYYTRRAQPFTYGDHSIFTAETASTVNENLLIKYLISEEDRKLSEKPKDEEALAMKKYLLNLYLEEFRSTVFRQTMFAEFEKITHEEAEKGNELTSEFMCEKYGELNGLYFGPDVICDEDISYEWARIPHFYRAFYVYKYATGYSAAAAISEKILKGDGAAGEYRKFLESGSHGAPIELLKLAGVDMAKPDAIKSGIELFGKLVSELESLI